MDDWICDKVEKTCHRLQRNFGISLKLVKYAAVLVYAVASCVVAVDEIMTKGFDLSTGIFTIFIFLFPLMLVWWADKVDETVKPGSDTCNPRRIDPFHKTVRIFLYVMTLYFAYPVIYEYLTRIITPVSAARLVEQIAYTLFWILLACTPLPPQKSRIKKWVENFFAVKETHAVTASS